MEAVKKIKSGHSAEDYYQMVGLVNMHLLYTTNFFKHSNTTQGDKQEGEQSL